MKVTAWFYLMLPRSLEGSIHLGCRMQYKLQFLFTSLIISLPVVCSGNDIFLSS
jgi:hypothetical protein